MRFELLFAIRFFGSIKKIWLARFTAVVATAGIAGGVAATIFANSLANGFRQEMQNKILASTAHIVVSAIEDAEITDWQELREQIAQIQGVRIISAASFDNALIISESGSSYAVLRGVENLQPKVQDSVAENERSKIAERRLEIEIGKDLAAKINLTAGATAEIVAGSGQLGEKFSPVSTTVEIADTFSTGLYESDSTLIRVSLADAARLTGKTTVSVTALEIITDDIYRSNQTAARIQSVVPTNYKVLDWQEANRPLFAALTLERRITILIVSLVIFLAILNVTTTLALLIRERRADIGVLKTCGASRKSVVLIFLLQGALIGAVGVTMGVLLGLVVCAASNHFNLISLPPDVYSINRIILEPQSGEVFLTAITAFVLTLAASAFPAARAAQVRPLESLKS